ncbi:MAG: hypothetical protein ACE5EQ_02780 [Phycisphaerae bacterium]
MKIESRCIRGWTSRLLACAVFCGLAAPVIGQDVVTIKVRGQGLDEDGAVKDALRKAVEQGGKNEIASRSKTRDYALEYDVVLSRASGLVSDYKMIGRPREANGIVTVEIEAKVKKGIIDATWADVAIELKKLGRPKIMVMFTEVIHDLERPEGSREIVQRSSSVGTTIKRKLQKLGFKLKDAAQMKAIKEKKAELASAEDDTATLKALASSYGAAIIIKGQSRATGPDKKQTPAGLLNMWESDVTIAGLWTETGDMIFSNAPDPTRGGSRVAGPAGARQTLKKAGEILGKAVVYDLLEAWTRGTAGGVGDVIVEVRDVASVRQAIAIKKALVKISGVEEVTKEGVKGTVTFTVATAQGAEEFLEALVELTFADFMLEVEDQKMKTIICTVKSNTGA